MTNSNYIREQTALLLVDPYNDFLSDGGKLWPYVKDVAQSVGLHDNLRKITAEVRRLGLRIFVVPHHRWEPGDFEGWAHPNPDQIGGARLQTFAKGTWGGEWHPDFVPQSGDIIAKEHWGQNGFANTDLNIQLQQHGIRSVILVGLIANTCIEATGRYAMELGYHVTLVKDATAAFSPDRMHAAHELNGPNFAHAILTTQELLAALQAPMGNIVSKG
jgi:nicotinamidase-related amidase